jgi:hypothetical protein
MIRPLLVSILFAALTIAIASPVEAGTIDADFATYLADLPDGAFASAIVYLKDQPDIRALDDALRTQGAPMAVRHERVLTTLREARESQPALQLPREQADRGAVELHLVLDHEIRRLRDHAEIDDRPRDDVVHEANFAPDRQRRSD